MESPATQTHALLVDAVPDRPVALDNCTCVYCGGELTPETTSREHVIGRRFVPKGKLHAKWNLIVNACRVCNGRKSDLENDISAITLQPDLWGRYGHDDADAIADARRRAGRAHSRRTRKLIEDSHEQIKLNGQLGPGINVSFQFTSPAQIDDARAFELARMQLMAFFYMQTFDRDTKRGSLWQQGFHPVIAIRRGDWGNPLAVGFSRTIQEWDPRLVGVTADGFFKVITRKHPTAETWAWAIEWNHAYRLIGFFGEREPAQEIVNGLPRVEARTVYQAPNESLAYRIETPLKDEDDLLFHVPGTTDLPEEDSADQAP